MVDFAKATIPRRDNTVVDPRVDDRRVGVEVRRSVIKAPG